MTPMVFLLTLMGQTWSAGPDGIPVPQIELFNQPTTPFTAPGRLFSIEVPPGWAPALKKRDPDTVEIQAISRPGNAVLQIRRMAVPRGAHPRQLLLNALDRRLKKLPSFKMASKRDLTLAGYQAASVTGSYLYQGNVQYPLVLEEVYLVTGSEAFVLHFECFEPAAADLATELNKLYTTFQPRPGSGAEGPFVPKEPGEAMPNPNTVPF